MIKKMMLSLVLLVSSFSNGQTFLEAYESTRVLQPSENLNGLSNDVMATLRGNPNEWSKIMGVFAQFDDIQLAKKGFKGSIYLFDKWDQQAVVYANSKKFVFPNLNYNIEKDQFMVKYQDSTFVFHMDKIERVVVKNQHFKLIDNKVHEIVYENKDYSILKKYTVELIEASPNPMANRTKNKIKQKSKMFLVKNDDFNSFRLKKSEVLALVPDKDKKKVTSFVKDNKLSFKKEKDVGIILSYASTLK